MKVLYIVVFVCSAVWVFAQEDGPKIDKSPFEDVSIVDNSPNEIPAGQFSLNMNSIHDLEGNDPIWAFNLYYRYGATDETWVDLKVISPFFRSFDNTLPDEESPRPLKTYANIQLQGHSRFLEYQYIFTKRMKVAVHKFDNGAHMAVKGFVPVNNAVSFEVDYGLEYMRSSTEVFAARPYGSDGNPGDLYYHTTGSQVSSAVFGLSIRNSFHTAFDYQERTKGKWGTNRLFINGLVAVRAAYDMYETDLGVSESPSVAVYEEGLEGIELNRLGYRIGWERIATVRLSAVTIKYGLDFTNQPHYWVLRRDKVRKLTDHYGTFRVHFGLGFGYGRS